MIVTREIVIEKFFDRVEAHFQLGRTRPKDTFVTDLVKALIRDRVPAAVIEEAAMTAISNHKGPGFPSVALCRHYCGEARVTAATANSEPSYEEIGE